MAETMTRLRSQVTTRREKVAEKKAHRVLVQKRLHNKKKQNKHDVTKVPTQQGNAEAYMNKHETKTIKECWVKDLKSIHEDPGYVVDGGNGYWTLAKFHNPCNKRANTQTCICADHQSRTDSDLHLVFRRTTELMMIEDLENAVCSTQIDRYKELVELSKPYERGSE